MGCTRRRLAVAVAVLGAIAANAAAAQGASLRPGDILITDPNAFGGEGGVVKVNPRNGAQSVLSTNATSTQDLFQDPIGIAISRKGAILVADNGALAPDAGSDGALIRINAQTGEQSLFVDGTEPGALIDEPDGLAFSPKGFLAVVDFDAEGDDSGALIRVNPRTGSESLIAANSTSATDLFADPVALAFERSGSLVVAEFEGPPGGDPGVIRAQVGRGELTGLSLGGDFVDPYGVLVLPGGRLIVADEASFPGGGGGLIAVNPRTGAQTPVSNNAISGPDLFVEPTALIREARGSYAVVDYDAFADNDGGVIRVNPRTGAQSVLSSNDGPGPDLFDDPFDIAVVPPRCGGQFATIYGGSKADVLKGTRFADVIVGLAGNDRISGLRGNDRICGGRGRDRLRGGAGRDRLRGGPGADLLVGGRGRDRLAGGPGRDTERQ